MPVARGAGASATAGKEGPCSMQRSLPTFEKGCQPPYRSHATSLTPGSRPGPAPRTASNAAGNSASGSASHTRSKRRSSGSFSLFHALQAYAVCAILVHDQPSSARFRFEGACSGTMHVGRGPGGSVHVRPMRCPAAFRRDEAATFFTMNPVQGGKSIYGAGIGILMLETRFPRIPGDVGNAATWPFPVLYRVVKGASPDRVVRQAADGLLDAFVKAGRALVRDGADGLTTSCGFLALHQEDLAHACGVPVAASSLMQVPAVEALLPPGRRAGILTISRASLTERHLTLAGVSLDTPVSGTDGGAEFTRVILNDEPALDVELARQDVVDAARRLAEGHPEVGAIVLECTNMSPYSADIAEAVGLPVYDFVSLITWFQSGLRPRRP